MIENDDEHSWQYHYAILLKMIYMLPPTVQQPFKKQTEAVLRTLVEELDPNDERLILEIMLEIGQKYGSER